MARLFGRTWFISVGDVDVSDLACAFSVKKTLKPEPNSCTLKIYNLAPNTRSKLTRPKSIKVRIEAGYGSQVSQIYLGDVRSLVPGSVEGADIVTELETGDGEQQIATSHLSVPVGAKARPGDVLQAIVSALGVGSGNVATAAAKLASTGVAMFPRGSALTGNVARVLTDFCRSAGLEWSIQDGAIQILDIGGALASKPYVLAPDTGLIGSPKVDKDGKITASTFLLPELRPGLRVQFDSKFVKGVFRIHDIEYSGDTWGADWDCKITTDKPGSTE